VGEQQPPKNWPGLEAERDGVVYDAKKIENIAKELREIMKPIGGGGYGVGYQGSINDLRFSGSLTDVRQQLQSIDGWEAGKSFAATLAQAHQELVAVYEEVLENFGIAIALVEDGAGVYKVTNAANGYGV
jgi:hypothetical protein